MKQDEAISLAGHVLSRGNPFKDAAPVGLGIRNLLPPEHRDFLYEKISNVLSPYIDVAMSLAGHVLGEQPRDEGPTVPIELMAGALRLGAGWFREYEAHHAAQPGEGRDIKAARNGRRAEVLENALKALGGEQIPEVVAEEVVCDDAELPADVIELVIAAREIAFGDLFGGTLLDEEGQAAFKRLDKASEAFAERVEWPDQ